MAAKEKVMRSYRSSSWLVSWIVVLGVTLLQQGTTLYSKAGDPGRRWADSEVLIKFRPAATALERASARVEVNGRILRTFNSGAEQWRLGLGQTVERALEKLKKNPRVEYAEPNYVIVPVTVPDDTLFSSQWPLLNSGGQGGTADADIDADGAWDRTTGCGEGTPGCSQAVRVAVTDTGIAFHEDLEENVDRSLSYDFANDDPDADPGCVLFPNPGHGTHVGGIIGAVGNNGQGIAGVNWQVRLMALKIFPSAGTLEGFVADAVAAIDYATAHDADIINASWQINDVCELPCAQTLYDAIANAGAHDIAFVVAAGNHSNQNNDIPGVGRFPAAYDLPNLIAVAATDRKDKLWSGSAYGPTSVDLGAPGVSVNSTLPGPVINQLPCERGPGIYDIRTGTSMAAPHVAGAAALLRALDPSVSVARMKEILMGSTDRLSDLQGKTVSGGRLNARCAVETLIQDTDGDLRGDACDNCPPIYNPDQADPNIGNPVVTVQFPNGGNLLSITSQVTLTWNATDACGGVTSVDLLLSRNGPGGPFSNIALNRPNTGSYVWSVTGPATSNAFLKVVARDPGMHQGEDLSNSAFFIASCGPCQVSYCQGGGFRCQFNNSCGPGGCCNYTCGIPDASCEVPDPCPPNICNCF
ncbi:MAG TPA: S8 family serine peptidase [Candidatus Polarisedimenticolia bacterium]|nr:S8 family serine peptidase [Candidatus Polarisedimenticolia bacterium]